MDWMLFWTAFGAIGGTLGAIAVIVALWQVKHSEKKKLNMSKRVSFFVMDSTGRIYRVKSSKTVSEMIKE